MNFCLIDLAEVQSVANAPPAQVGTKKVDEKAFFDVRPQSLKKNYSKRFNHKFLFFLLVKNKSPNIQFLCTRSKYGTRMD